MAKTKFMQTLEPEAFRAMKKLAKKRGIPLQEMIRAVVIPEWLALQK